MAGTNFRGCVLALVMLLAPALAQAAVIEAVSHVTDATIYTDRALVTRMSRVHIAAGVQTVSIADMPAGLNEATLRVQGKATAAVKIGTVELKHIYMSELANTVERDKEVLIDARQNDKAMLEAEVDALKTKQQFIIRIGEAGALKHDDAGSAKLDFSPEKWQQAWNLLQAGMTEAGKDMAIKNVAIARIDADIVRLQQEMAQAHSQQAKERRDARVTVEASADTDLDLTLTYQTLGARWNPVYEARLDTNESQLDLEQYGSVTQTTGEDWNEVGLTLSTAQPASGSEMPALSEWIVNLFRPTVAANMRASGNAMQMLKMAAPAPTPRADSAAEANGIALPTPIGATIDTASVASTEYSAEFKVPGRVDLKSSSDATKLRLGDLKMKAELGAQTTPRLDPQAYLFAKATNNETYPLIPGVVAKYRDGAFIGNAKLPLIRPNEKADFSFGVDDRIKVDYKRTNDTQDTPTLVVVGDVTIERQYQTKVQNLHKDRIAITVFDQYPVAMDPDVKSTLLDDQTTQGYVQDPDKRQGVIAWTDSYKQQDQKTYTLGFRVKYPKGQTVQGL